MQLPASLATYQGPDYVYDLVSPGYQQLFPGRPLLGLPIREALPELEGQGYFELFAQVYDTGEPHYALEQPAMARFGEGEGQWETRYFNINIQALRDAQGRVSGLLNFAYDVTAQVLARQQVQTLNEELAAINEELTASNAEYLAANAALAETQQLLRQRTQEREASYRATEALQAELLAAAQRQVQERESLYQVFAQSPAVVLLLRESDHRIAYINAAGERLFPGRMLQGRTIAESQPESAAQGFVALLDRVYQTGETYLGAEVPLTVQDAAGQPARTTYLNFSYQAYREQDQIVGISVFAYDVTEVVLARQQREDLQAELLATAQRQVQEREDLYQVFAQTAAVVVLLRGPGHRIEYVNPACERLFQGRFLPGHLVTAGFPEVEAQGFVALLDHVYQTGETFLGAETPFTSLDAEGQPAQTTYFNFSYQAYREQGHVVGVIAFAYEVTEQVLTRQQVQDLNQELAAINEELTATNEELHESNTRLTRTNADLDNFIYTASHDLRTPISNVEGLLALLEELLPEAVREDEEVRPVLTRMRESTERFTRTIAHLTDLSRLQAEFSQPVEAVPLATIVADVRQDLQPQFIAAHAELTVAVEGSEPRVFSAKNLRSLVYNLLSNALKYRHPDRPARVRLACARDGDQLVLTVQDNGLGLSETQQKRLFQLFQRLHTHVEGTGVGLYAVKKIVENVGGTIAVVSELGVGTTFTLTFPA